MQNSSTEQLVPYCEAFSRNEYYPDIAGVRPVYPGRSKRYAVIY
jgi:hypothetical protein